jgi:F-type H+-transporting ATPase subunit delta
MTNRTAAARYARALFDVSVKHRDLRQVESDVVGFAALLEGHDDLGRVLLNPAIPTAGKTAIVDALLDRMDPLEAPVAKLLRLLAERDRLVLLPDIVEAYRDRLLRHLGIVEARVTTAMAVSDDRLAAIERRLSTASGGKITMTADVDAELLGGLVARLGTTVYDGSIANHLERMRSSLLES